MSRKADLLKRKAEAERMIAEGTVLVEYQAYLLEANEDTELSFHYYMRDTILEFKKLRNQQGISQAELAQRMGTNQTAVSRFESYSGEPSLRFPYKYALALGVELNRFSFGYKTPYGQPGKDVVEQSVKHLKPVLKHSV